MWLEKPGNQFLLGIQWPEGFGNNHELGQWRAFNREIRSRFAIVPNVILSGKTRSIDRKLTVRSSIYLAFAMRRIILVLLFIRISETLNSAIGFLQIQGVGVFVGIFERIGSFGRNRQFRTIQNVSLIDGKSETGRGIFR